MKYRAYLDIETARLGCGDVEEETLTISLKGETK